MMSLFSGVMELTTLIHVLWSCTKDMGTGVEMYVCLCMKTRMCSGVCSLRQTPVCVLNEVRCFRAAEVLSCTCSYTPEPEGKPTAARPPATDTHTHTHIIKTTSDKLLAPSERGQSYGAGPRPAKAPTGQNSKTESETTN